MYVELHLLQNFVPSNLNRDDTGAPKDCEFGGYRRARISSQCLKRSIRQTFGKERLLAGEYLGERTARLSEAVAHGLAERGREENAVGVARAGLLAIGLEFQDKRPDLTEYLIFLGRGELGRLIDICADQWPTLAENAALAEGGKSARKTKKPTFPREVVESLRRTLDGRRAADVALFGRMLADLADQNIDAACQVAHAISTNQVTMEFDFYTAVDDLKTRSEDAGAGMLGTVEFNSACYYRYANIDLEQLRRNLQGDEDLARGTVEAFLRASIAAIPTGKQNSTAAQNPPSLVMAVVRERGLWSLANAFLRPVSPWGDRDLMQGSVAALDAHWGKLTRMYGAEGIGGVWVTLLDDGDLSVLKPQAVPNVETLIAGVRGAIGFAGAAVQAG